MHIRYQKVSVVPLGDSREFHTQLISTDGSPIIYGYGQFGRVYSYQLIIFHKKPKHLVRLISLTLLSRDLP